MDTNNLEVSPLELLAVANDPSLIEADDCTAVYSMLAHVETGAAGQLLKLITSMMLKPSSPRTPFNPMIRFGEGASFCIGNASRTQVFCMSSITSNIVNSELRARLSDYVWCEKAGGIEQAHIAVASYIDSARNLDSKGEKFSAVTRLERALRLNYSLRRGGAKNASLVNEFAIWLLEKKDLVEYPVALIRLAAEFGIKDDNFLYETAFDLSNELVADKQFRRAVSLLEASQACAVAMNDKQKEYKAIEAIALCHEKEAEHHPSLLAAGCLKASIDALRNIPGTREKQEDLYVKMRTHQRELKHQMKTVTFSSGDISDRVKAAEKMVQGLDFQDSIFRLALAVTNPIQINKLKKVVQENIENSIFADLGADHIDSDGLTIARTPGLGEGEDNAALESFLMQALRLEHRSMVHSSILPAMEEIANTFYFDKEAWMPLLENNPFVPRDHIDFFARGLTAGLQGDFLISSHLLIPQIENSLRYCLEQLDAEPTTLHGNGDQERDGIKFLLDHPKIISAFGPDILYTLRAVLIDRVYGGLRHSVSHGSISSYQMNDDAAVVLWWITLRIVTFPYYKYWLRRYGENLFSQFPEFRSINN
ncbi:DUF4209 domain-containing protein [Pseudomonas sp. DG56-2]|uniref:DUF4209 domain-containing protein n=1 Tax=Pseudomonas sp. DG56-2 TaxID=2320270 RepID=UPI0010A5DF14|nr:DUF4209 domain-containing protein [Pseudomonas sp. DG56-2]